MNKLLLFLIALSISLSYSSCKLFKPFYEKKKNNIIKDSSNVIKYREYKKMGSSIQDTIANSIDTITYIKAKIITIDANNDTTVKLIGQNYNEQYGYLNKILTQNNIEYQNASFKAKVNFDNGKQAQNFTTNFRIRRDSLTWCSISAIIGEVARAVVNQDSIKAIDKLSNKALVYSYQDLSSLIELNLPHNLLQELIIGNTLFDPKTDRVLNTSNDAYGTFVVRTLSPLGNFAYNFNADTTINTINLETVVKEKPYSVNVYYSNFINYEQYKIPTHRHFIIKQEEKITDVEIEVQKFNINVEALDYPFSIPKHFKRIFKKKE